VEFCAAVWAWLTGVGGGQATGQRREALYVGLRVAWGAGIDGDGMGLRYEVGYWHPQAWE
jgi:hypothetical protein